MNKTHAITISAIVLAFVGILMATKPTPVISPLPSNYRHITPTQRVASPSATMIPGNQRCHINGVLPDSSCTPGVANPHVSQSNITHTICQRGWTGTIRPPQSYTTPLKIQGIKDYGYTVTSLANYEEDHFIPLEVGGDPTDPRNLWPEPASSFHLKDQVENQCRYMVCSGRLSLVQAQQQIVTNWQTACK